MRLIVVAMCLNDPYGQQLSIPRTGGWSLVTEEDFLPRTVHTNFEHLMEKNTRYFVIVGRSEKFRIWTAHQNKNCVFYSEEKKAML